MAGSCRSAEERAVSTVDPPLCPSTVATFVTVDPAGAVTVVTTLSETEAPRATVPGWRHVTTLAASAQVQPSPPAETNVSPSGRSSTTVTGATVSVGPSLVTVTSHVAVRPSSPASVFAIDRSARPATGSVVAEELSSVDSGPSEGESTDPVLVVDG